MTRLFAVVALFLSVTAFAQSAPQYPRYNCIRDALQSYNSSIFSDLTNEDFDKILADKDAAFHNLILDAAVRCADPRE